MDFIFEENVQTDTSQVSFRLPQWKTNLNESSDQVSQRTCTCSNFLSECNKHFEMLNIAKEWIMAYFMQAGILKFMICRKLELWRLLVKHSIQMLCFDITDLNKCNVVHEADWRVCSLLNGDLSPSKCSNIPYPRIS